MVSAARATSYSGNQADVVGLAHRELQAFWETLDRSNPVTAKAEMADFLVALVDAYGPISATIAADFYDEIRAESGPDGPFVAEAAGATDVDQVRGSSDWGVQPLFDEVVDEGAALQRLLGATQRLVQEQGRQTLMLNVERDPAKPRWARMPIGETCRWCTMLASRGADYTSRASAVSKSNGGAFHDDCDCQPVVIWDGDDLPYDQEEYMNRYLADRAGTTSSERPNAFDAMSVEQLQNQLRITTGLKASTWRTAQLERLRTRLAELA